MFVPNVMGEMVFNGMANGPAGETMRGLRWEPGLMRPYFDKNDRPSVTINTGQWSKQDGRGGERVPMKRHVLIRDLQSMGFPVPPVANATTLRKEQWIELDARILTAARYRLRALADLGASSTYSVNGMGTTILEHETMTDPGEAIVDMDGLSEGRADTPKFAGQGMPLPLTHVDFWYSSRTIAASSNRPGVSLPLVNGEAAGRRIAETLEATVIGTKTGMVYGGVGTALTYTNTSAVYGYINFPQRLTKTNLTIPTGSNAATTLAEVLAMVDQLRANKFYGPFMLYTTADWDQFMDNDYILSGGNVATQTLRERLKRIDGIQDVRRLDMWFGSQPSSSTGPGTDVDATLKTYGLLLVQMTSEVCELVNGMGITTLQWEGKGGLKLMFKVMAIQAPRLRADAYGNCGILHATHA